MSRVLPCQMEKTQGEISWSHVITYYAIDKGKSIYKGKSFTQKRAPRMTNLLKEKAAQEKLSAEHSPWISMQHFLILYLLL